MSVTQIVGAAFVVAGLTGLVALALFALNRPERSTRRRGSTPDGR